MKIAEITSKSKPIYNLAYLATPPRGQKFFSHSIRDGLLNKTIKAQTILGLDPGMEIDETRLEMHGPEWQKFFALDSENLPVLIYPLARDYEPRPDAADVYKRMREVTAELCQNLGVDLTPGWEQGDWPAEALAVPLEAVRGNQVVS